MKLLGLAPSKIFSGFEKSFFDAVRNQGCEVTHKEVELPWFKLLCTITSFHPQKKRWGTRRDLHYHTSIAAFKFKSKSAAHIAWRHQKQCDAIYQVGGLWNPTSDKHKLPLILQVDYTSLLSAKRNSEWKRKPGKHQDFWVAQENKLFRDATIVLTTTENARSSIIDDYHVDPAHVVTVGGGVSAPYDDLNDPRRPDYNSKKILFVGKGFIGKGLDTLLEAFTTVHNEIPDSSLTIVGPTGLEVNNAGVNYLGRITDRDAVRKLYYEHSAFVMPSRFEPLGQVFLEAMSCRLPCIGTTLDAMPEIIDHSVTGYTIGPGNSNELAKYLKELLSSPELCQKMGEKGYQRLQDRYTWKVVGSKILKTIKKSIDSV